MNIDHFEERMIAALEGELNQKEYDDLMSEIKEDKELQNVWNSYKSLYHGFESVPFEKPSPKVRERFDDWVETLPKDQSKIVDIGQKSSRSGRFEVWRKWAGVAAVLVVVLGFWGLYNQNVRVERDMEKMANSMEELLNQQSSTERIKAIRVNFNSNSETVDDKLINMLIDVLKNDKSSNVRLAAVESLGNYMDSELVREAMIQHVTEEGDAGVKLSIITTLGQYKDENVKSTLEKIVNDDSQEKFVIDEAHMQLIRFETIDI